MSEVKGTRTFFFSSFFIPILYMNFMNLIAAAASPERALKIHHEICMSFEIVKLCSFVLFFYDSLSKVFFHSLISTIM